MKRDVLYGIGLCVIILFALMIPVNAIPVVVNSGLYYKETYTGPVLTGKTVFTPDNPDNRVTGWIAIPHLSAFDDGLGNPPARYTCKVWILKPNGMPLEDGTGGWIAKTLATKEHFNFMWNQKIIDTNGNSVYDGSGDVCDESVQIGTLLHEGWAGKWTFEFYVHDNSNGMDNHVADQFFTIADSSHHATTAPTAVPTPLPVAPTAPPTVATTVSTTIPTTIPTTSLTPITTTSTRVTTAVVTTKTSPNPTVQPVNVVTTQEPSGSLTKACSGTAISIYAEDRTVPQGSTVTIPIMVCNAKDLANMDLAVNYDTSFLKFISAEKGGLNANSLFESNEASPGTVMISFASSTGNSGSASVALLTFNVIGANGATSPIRITVKTASSSSGSIMPLSAFPGKFTVGTPTTISFNGGPVTSRDALAALQMAVGKIPTDMKYDVTKDGSVNSADARAIMKIVVSSR